MTRLHKTIRKRMDKAIVDFGLIEDGDKILIGVSGGPDSLSLLHLLREKQLFGENSFSLAVAHVELGFGEKGKPSWQILKDHVENLGLDLHIVHTTIKDIMLDPNARKSPCFICSHNRRRKIYEVAHKIKCNKIAYGHHKDDIIETLLINILYGRKIEAMHPMQEVFQGAMHIIRPLTYVDEEMLKKFAKESALPDLPRLCPLDGNTRRQKIKELIAQLQETEKYANIRENIFKSLFHINMNDSYFIKNTR